MNLAVFVRGEGLRFRAVLPAELKYHVGDGFVRSLHCFPEADLGPVRIVLVDHLSNGVCFQLDGLHRVFGGQIAGRGHFFLNSVGARFQIGEDGKTCISRRHIRAPAGADICHGEHRTGQGLVRVRVVLEDLEARVLAVFDGQEYVLAAVLHVDGIPGAVQRVAGWGFRFLDIESPRLLHVDGNNAGRGRRDVVCLAAVRALHTEFRAGKGSAAVHLLNPEGI